MNTRSPRKWFTRENLVLVVVVLPLLGYYHLGPSESRMVSVREALRAQGGNIGVEGVIEPPLNAETLSIRAIELEGTPMSYLQIRDETGVIGVHFDPADFALPEAGTQARVAGYKLRGSANVYYFIGTEIAAGELTQE